VPPDGMMMCCDSDIEVMIHDVDLPFNGDNHNAPNAPHSEHHHRFDVPSALFPDPSATVPPFDPEPPRSNLMVDECVTVNTFNPNRPPSDQLLSQSPPQSVVSKQRVVEVSILRSYHDEAKGVFGCKHYARNCFLKAECCDEWYVCRLCHDESNEEMDTHSGRAIKPHKINRYLTELAKCMRCGAEQKASKYCNSCNVDSADTSSDDDSVPSVPSAPSANPEQRAAVNMKEEKEDEDGEEEDDDDLMEHSNDSNGSNERNVSRRNGSGSHSRGVKRYEFGRYYCDICKFWEDAENKEIFHCPECGLCRLGRSGDYIHCKRCGCCLNYKYYAKHPCIENSLDSDCPICFTYLFKSREPVTFFMPCGHPIHYDCLVQYGKVSSLCPICRTKWYDEESERRKKIVSAIKENSNDDGEGDQEM